MQAIRSSKKAKVRIFEEFRDGRMFLLYLVVDAEVGGREGVEVFEHARGGTRSGDELENLLAFGSLLVQLGVAVDGLVVKP